MLHIPPEILGEIFLACLAPPVYYFYDYNAPLVGEQDTLFLSTICRVSSLWRDVALSTPALWDNLAYTMTCQVGEEEDVGERGKFATTLEPEENRQMSFHKGDIDFLRWWDRKVRGNSFSLRLQTRLQLASEPSDDTPFLAWGDRLKAACNCSMLDGSVNHSSSASLENDPFVHPFLKIVSRARYLVIVGLISSLLFAPDFLTEMKYPNLECLVIGENDRGIDIRGEQMPKLRMFASQNQILPSTNPADQSMWWGQLTHAILHVKTSHVEWFQFLSHCTSLQSATIHLTLTDRANLTTSCTRLRSFNLPNLRHLVIRRVDYGVSALMFDDIYFPLLDSLMLCGPYLTMECLHSILKATPELKTLRVAMPFPADLTAEEAELIALTGDLELIGHIHFPPRSAFTHLSEIEDANEMLHPLSSYVPKLKRLELALPNLHHVCPGSSASFEDEMMKSGWLQGLSQLQIDLFEEPSSLPHQAGR